MKKYRLHFESYPRGEYGRTVPFYIEIFANCYKDAHLIGERGVNSLVWSFVKAEEAE